MDGVSLNRLSPVRSLAAPVAPGAAGLAGGSAYLQDSLGLNSVAPAGGGAEQFVRATNVLNVLSASMTDAQTAQAAGDPNRAQQLRNYAEILQYTTDPALSQALAQAYVNPTASDQARRLSAALLGDQPLAGGYLASLLAVDQLDPRALAAQCPNNIFTSGQAKGSQLASQLLTEIATPAQAYQGNRETCGATVVQGMLADENPTKYVEVVTALAFYGQAYLPGGKVVNRDPNWNFAGDGSRPVTGRLLQPALMADAAGQYDNAADTVCDVRGQTKGLTIDEMQKLLQDVKSASTTSVPSLDWDLTNKQWVRTSEPDQLAHMEAAIAAGGTVPVLLTLDPTRGYGHYERVKAISGDQVTCLNPLGREEVMSAAQFRSRLITAFYP